MKKEIQFSSDKIRILHSKLSDKQFNMYLKHSELADFLEIKHDQYNRKSFIESDPISIPHGYSKLQDIEISGFLTSTIAWGKRSSIIKNASLLMELMDNEPFDFIKNCTDSDLKKMVNFKHRTFNSTDLEWFIKSLKNIYTDNLSMENLFIDNQLNIKNGIVKFREIFFEIQHPKRTQKHVSDPLKNSASKRLNMFLRWMVRKDNRGVDFGLWNAINQSILMCPLDVHSGNVARKLGLLTRKQNDWTAVEELTHNLRKFDATDPVKYDFSLFGLGVFEKF